MSSLGTTGKLLMTAAAPMAMIPVAGPFIAAGLGLTGGAMSIIGGNQDKKRKLQSANTNIMADNLLSDIQNKKAQGDIFDTQQKYQAMTDKTQLIDTPKAKSGGLVGPMLDPSKIFDIGGGITNINPEEHYEQPIPNDMVKDETTKFEKVAPWIGLGLTSAAAITKGIMSYDASGQQSNPGTVASGNDTTSVNDTIDYDGTVTAKNGGLVEDLVTLNGGVDQHLVKGLLYPPKMDGGGTTDVPSWMNHETNPEFEYTYENGLTGDQNRSQVEGDLNMDIINNPNYFEPNSLLQDNTNPLQNPNEERPMANIGYEDVIGNAINKGIGTQLKYNPLMSGYKLGSIENTPNIESKSGLVPIDNMEQREPVDIKRDEVTMSAGITGKKKVGEDMDTTDKIMLGTSLVNSLLGAYGMASNANIVAPQRKFNPRTFFSRTAQQTSNMPIAQQKVAGENQDKQYAATLFKNLVESGQNPTIAASIVSSYIGEQELKRGAMLESEVARNDQFNTNVRSQTEAENTANREKVASENAMIQEKIDSENLKTKMDVGNAASQAFYHNMTQMVQPWADFAKWKYTKKYNDEQLEAYRRQSYKV